MMARNWAWSTFVGQTLNWASSSLQMGRRFRVRVRSWAASSAAAVMTKWGLAEVSERLEEKLGGRQAGHVRRAQGRELRARQRPVLGRGQGVGFGRSGLPKTTASSVSSTRAGAPSKDPRPNPPLTGLDSNGVAGTLGVVFNGADKIGRPVDLPDRSAANSTSVGAGARENFATRGER